jgi:hypothetical protein
MVDAPVPTHGAPLTAEAFYADRKRVYGTFTGMTMAASMAIAVLLILMAVFLL